jgi:hypothetical protein
MATYILQVNIDPGMLPFLRDGGYYLCIAKKVNEKYNVVWSGQRDFLAANIYQWKENYQVFGIQSFKQGDIVKPVTAEQDIAFGQTCVFVDGTSKPAQGTPDDSGKFSVVNECAVLGVGVNCDLGLLFVFLIKILIYALLGQSPMIEVIFHLHQSLCSHIRHPKRYPISPLPSWCGSISSLRAQFFSTKSSTPSKFPTHQGRFLTLFFILIWANGSRSGRP